MEKSDSIYLGLKQRYGSQGIAVECDVLFQILLIFFIFGTRV
jgi:hypothetical protein